MLLCFKQLVLMEISGYLQVVVVLKGDWKSVVEAHGELFVMTSLEMLTLKLHATSSVSKAVVSDYTSFRSFIK